jgi:heme exporter protein C
MRYASLAFGLLLLIVGHGMGLFWAPEEAMMGDVGRILYCHVPTAWVALVVYLIAFIAACTNLWTGSDTWDATVEAAVEVGILLNSMLLMQGSIWARPTWGVWWTWDPRLTTTAIMVVSFIGVLVLRNLVNQPERRKLVTSVATIVAFISVPLVYFSVKMWNSLHQPMSSPETVSSTMVLPLRVTAFGMLFTSLGFIGIRRRIALKHIEDEGGAPDLPAMPEPLNLGAR